MFNTRLKKLRKERGYTQTQIAEKLNINRSTYSYYESGKTNPDIGTILKIAEIYQIHYSEILETEKENILIAREIRKKSSLNENHFKRIKNSPTISNFLNLSEQELTLVNKFRKLSEKNKKSVFDFVEIKFKSN